MFNLHKTQIKNALRRLKSLMGHVFPLTLVISCTGAVRSSRRETGAQQRLSECSCWHHQPLGGRLPSVIKRGRQSCRGWRSLSSSWIGNGAQMCTGEVEGKCVVLVFYNVHSSAVLCTKVGHTPQSQPYIPLKWLMQDETTNGRQIKGKTNMKCLSVSDAWISSDIIRIHMYAWIIHPPPTRSNYFSYLETHTCILNDVEQHALSRWFLYCVPYWCTSVFFKD